MTLPTNSLTFHKGPAPEEVIRIDAEGFHYRGQFIEDAGEAHRLLVEFLRQHQPNTNWRHAEVSPMTQPLWQRIGGATGPYDIGPEEIAGILVLIADEVERRGVIDYDRDPGETSDWLRAEAEKARQAV